MVMFMKILKSDISVENESFTDIVRYENTSISGATIKKSNIGSPIFFNCNIYNVTFDICDLTNARFFSGCTIEQCKFISSDLRAIGIAKDEAIFINCEFTSCDMRGMTIENAKFVDCVFTKCKFHDRILQISNVINCSFSGRLVDITFEGSGKQKLIANFENCMLEGVIFVGCDLTQTTPPRLKNHYYIDHLSKRVKSALINITSDQSLSTDEKKILLRKLRKLGNSEQYIFNINHMKKIYGDNVVGKFFNYLGLDNLQT